MTRLELFRTALERTEELERRYPDDRAVEQCAIQFRYLIALELGERNDRRNLENVNIGVLAVREIEPLDPSLADMIYKAVEEVELMKNEHQRRNSS
jgi:predicted nucleotidyltransferase